MRLPNIIVAIRGEATGASSETKTVTTIGNKTLDVRETSCRVYGIRTVRSAGVGEQAHDRRLDDGHESHIAVRDHRDRGEQIRRDAGCHENGGRPVHGADDGNRAGGGEIEPEAESQQDGGEDAEVSGSAQQGHARILKQRAKIGHGAQADEQEERENFSGDADGVQLPEQAFWAGDAGQRQIGEDGSEADRQEQDGFHVLCDGQVDQHPADEHHHTHPPGQGGWGEKERERIFWKSIGIYSKTTKTAP